MSFVIIDFSYLFGRCGELVVKDMTVVNANDKRVSSYKFKKPYELEEIPIFIRRFNNIVDKGLNWNDDGDIEYSELKTVIGRETSEAVAIFCFGTQKTTYIRDVTGRTVTDIFDLEGFPLIRLLCTFTCYDRFMHWSRINSIG